MLHTLFTLFPASETPTNAFEPIPLRRFLVYFVVPHVITTLIAQDHQTSNFSNAHGILVESSDAGELINPEDDNDNELEEINRLTSFTLKRFNFHTSKGLGERPTQQENRSRENDAAGALVALQQAGKLPEAHNEVCVAT